MLRLLASLALFAALIPSAPATASHTPTPTSVTVAGSLQSELGCPSDWQPECTTTRLVLDTSDDVWQGSWTVPAGSYEYKAALNGSWTENYGLHAMQDGANVPLNLSTTSSVKFYYDHKTHWITDNKSAPIAVAPGSFQSELGCPGDWDPGCLRSWLQDPDGDGVFSFETTALPAGSYEAKVALNEAWDENYGQGGVRDGANIPFTVPSNGAKTTFSYNVATHLLSIRAGHGADNNVEWDGLRHDSRDLLYRTPGGAAPAGTPVIIRFRTFHNDVTAVALRVFDINANGQRILPMTRAASGISCYQPGLESETCDFWAVSLPNASPNNLWYRFIVTDGTDTDYYADDTPALDGGLGRATDDVVDQSYALMVYDPAFTAPAWAREAVIYQIFPDRFRNGSSGNDAHTDDVRYDDPVLALPWATKPEGFCRNYVDANTACPWRFDTTPPADSPAKEQPRGRDYLGGDLKGVDQKLDYLKSIGVNTIYFNPLFDAGSNHSYDTQDYVHIDPYFGSQQDWDFLVKHARDRGMRIILDGVFNHLSSDSPFFDRYHHYDTVGACESASSPYRSWFTFRAPAGNEPAACAPSTPGGNDTFYAGWFGFDSIPVLNKANPAVQAYFLTAPDSVTRHWLNAGAGGWRLDVAGDPSFPNGYWETFRGQVKSTSPNALIVGELWQKDSTLLRYLRGDRMDTTMDYRMRDAVIGLLAPGSFDSKGFADSGRPLKPSEFASRLQSIREDYPDAAYFSLMNLLDSHDTERALWTLTPGPETTAGRENDLASVTDGKNRLRLASLIQFTLPGAPTVYYGDEVGVTGDDDPDDRRTYPWADRGGQPDNDLLAHYTALGRLRDQTGALTDGDFQVRLADDAAGTVAYGRKTGQQAALIAVNQSSQPRTLTVPLAVYLPDGIRLRPLYGVGTAGAGGVTVQNGQVQLTLGPLSAIVLATDNKIDLTAPREVDDLRVTSEGHGQVGLAWSNVPGAVSFNVYRSPLSGGGFLKVGSTTTTKLTDSGLLDARSYYYVVRAVDKVGNEGRASNEVTALPHLVINWANLQFPAALTHTISTTNRTANVYGQVWIDGVTNQPGPTDGLTAQLGFGPDGSNPAANPNWTWVDATFNVDAGNNDEFVASLLPEAVGAFDYAYRYSTTNGRDWVYADLDGIPNGYSLAQAGALTVLSSGDSTAPAVPGGLRVVTASPIGIDLAWNAVTGDTSLYGYEVLRGNTAGGPYNTLARLAGATVYTDTSVAEGATYYYVVRALDTSFNRSANSSEVSAVAALRTVTLTFTVTVPASTDGTGRAVHIAGFLDRLDGNLPQWDPAATALTRLDSTHWQITFSGKEGTQIEYKYTLGAWDFVEKGSSCDEINNRQLTLSYGSTGSQAVNDNVPNWRNVAPCGN